MNETQTYNWTALTEKIRREDAERPLCDALPDLVRDILPIQVGGTVGAELRRRVTAAADRYSIDGYPSRVGEIRWVR